MPCRGQTLVSLALLLPLVLLPVMAYAVEATLLATTSSRLQAAVARAAEDGSAAIDVGALRAGRGLVLDPVAARTVALGSLAAADPAAIVDSVSVTPSTVTVRAHERVTRGFGVLLGVGTTLVAATASARVTAGYASPSSRLPLPKRSLSITA
jgi:hypothetical protein